VAAHSEEALLDQAFGIWHAEAERPVPVAEEEMAQVDLVMVAGGLQVEVQMGQAAEVRAAAELVAMAVVVPDLASGEGASTAALRVEIEEVGETAQVAVAMVGVVEMAPEAMVQVAAGIVAVLEMVVAEQVAVASAVAVETVEGLMVVEMEETLVLGWRAVVALVVDEADVAEAEGLVRVDQVLVVEVGQDHIRDWAWFSDTSLRESCGWSAWIPQRP